MIFPLLVTWDEPQYATLRNNQPWYWAYAVNFSRCATKGKATTLNTVHFWSLSIEEQFLIPLALRRLGRAGPTLLRIAAVVAVVGLQSRIWLALADPLTTPAPPM